MIENHHGRRDRSVKLDPVKVKKIAEYRGIKSLINFEREFLRHIGASQDTHATAPANAWYGKKLDKNKATAIAIFLGLSGYEMLLPTACPDLIYPENLHWDAHYSPPGALLKAEYGIVPFHHRRRELEDLAQWCFSDYRLAIRLYTGSGGMGKTRLAIEQCRQLHEKYQWITGFLHQKSTLRQHEEAFHWLERLMTPVLIVIDYAETRRHELVILLRTAMRCSTKVRIILLARAANSWWNTLQTEGYGVGDLLMSRATTCCSLQPLSMTLKEREESYFLAADHFAQCLTREPVLTVPHDLSTDYFERVLLLHMQALIEIEGHQAEQNSQGILAVILNRERRFWEAQANERMLPRSLHKAIGMTMAHITLLGGVNDKIAALQIVDNIPLLAGSKRHERQAIVELLHSIYPSPAFTHDAKHPRYYIDPLQPDLLGEYLVEEELKDDPTTILKVLWEAA